MKAVACRPGGNRVRHANVLLAPNRPCGENALLARSLACAAHACKSSITARCILRASFLASVSAAGSCGWEHSAPYRCDLTHLLLQIAGNYYDAMAAMEAEGATFVDFNDTE